MLVFLTGLSYTLCFHSTDSFQRDLLLYRPFLVNLQSTYKAFEFQIRLASQQLHVSSSVLYWFLRASITNFSRLGGQTQQKLFDNVVILESPLLVKIIACELTWWLLEINSHWRMGRIRVCVLAKTLWRHPLPSMTRVRGSCRVVACAHRVGGHLRLGQWLTLCSTSAFWTFLVVWVQLRGTESFLWNCRYCLD